MAGEGKEQKKEKDEGSGSKKRGRREGRERKRGREGGMDKEGWERKVIGKEGSGRRKEGEGDTGSFPSNGLPVICKQTSGRKLQRHNAGLRWLWRRTFPPSHHLFLDRCPIFPRFNSRFLKSIIFPVSVFVVHRELICHFAICSRASRRLFSTA
ncbi:hypothetical protein E2C01_102055 [Portunus trituberculatus]|uniref:Uncharacterized protein n=1 Tax=Portunus trituberculatus TaxID=210409 RepID=A0A5B7K746_PORTR|nr:hypothetical protein [Portunus trituberculatus]